MADDDEFIILRDEGKITKTYDQDGKLHSYNNEPAIQHQFQISLDEYYFHGVKVTREQLASYQRDSNKPIVYSMLYDLLTLKRR